MHRSSTTRMVHEIYETIESSADRDSIITKLKQCKISLEEKLEAIKQQDGEILKLVRDEEVEHEIEEADTVPLVLDLDGYCLDQSRAYCLLTIHVILYQHTP